MPTSVFANRRGVARKNVGVKITGGFALNLLVFSFSLGLCDSQAFIGCEHLLFSRPKFVFPCVTQLGVFKSRPDASNTKRRNVTRHPKYCS